MYNFKQTLEKLKSKGRLEIIKEKIALDMISDRIKNTDKALLFENTGTDYQVASNVCTRENFCTIFDIEWKELQQKVADAMDNPIEPVVVDENPFNEVINMTEIVDIGGLIDSINEFVKERDWEPHHTPKNIATSVSIEAAELLEHFQWEDITYDEIKKDPMKLQAVSHEIADIIIYLFRLIYNLELEFEEIIREKIEENKEKYPIQR